MKIFTYGALMSARYMEEIGVDASTRRQATLHDYALRFNKQATDNPLKGYATISPAPGKNVYGIVYAIPEKSLKILDLIEDYPHGYTREQVIVSTPTDPGLKVTAYIAHPELIKENLLPSEDYIRKLLESSDMLPEEYLAWLKSIETLPEL